VFATFSRSWELAKASLSVLRSDKELLLFPLVSFIGLVVVTLSFAVPWLLLGGLRELDTTGQPGVMTYVLAFLFYVVSYTVIFFCNTALVGAAMIRLDGGDPTLSDGFRIAFARLPQIIGYALIAATVGMILRWISERAGIVGQIVAGIIGFAWNIATFLVVPVLAVEKVGPIDAIKRSAGLLRRTWGEQLVGNAGIGIVFGLLAFLFILLGVGLTIAVVQASAALAIVVVVATILIVGTIALIGSAASGIFTASLYRYATKGEPGTNFRAETMSAAFRAKDGTSAPMFGQPR
jgi:hypothetical protein